MEISFTMSELIGGVAAICAMITGVAAVITILISIIKKIKTPNDLQNKRLDEIEKRMDRYDELLAKDLKRFEKIEDGNRIMQRSMLALLSHGIDGNHTQSLIKARDELQEYLISQN